VHSGVSSVYVSTSSGRGVREKEKKRRVTPSHARALSGPHGKTVHVDEGLEGFRDPPMTGPCVIEILRCGLGWVSSRDGFALRIFRTSLTNPW
jgi:hypothetical protein